MNRIAVIEDNERLSGMIRKALTAVGIEADVFPSMASAWHALQNTPYAALVVDRGLPDGDGVTLVQRLRQAHHRTPCMILTARDGLHDRVDGLEAGADDYLVKPFSMEELVARVRALMRRPMQLESLSPGFGDIQVDPMRALLLCGSGSLMLAPAELQMLLCLVKAAGKPVRRTALEAAAWGLNTAVTPNALDVAIHRLRKKLSGVASTLHLVNIRGLGYALSNLSQAI